jgi:RNA polymerase sigma-70 factor (ECF subfamily)
MQNGKKIPSGSTKRRFGGNGTRSPVTSMQTSQPVPEHAPAPSEFCARLFEQEFSFLYWTFRRHGVRPAEAEDLTQEAFVVLWRRRKDLIPGRPVRPWLAGVAFHLASKHLARRGRESTGLDQDIRDRAPLPDEGLAAARDRAVVEEVFARLPDRHRRALELHEIEGVPMRSLAEQWGVPLFTAYTRVRAARKAFAAAASEAARTRGLNLGRRTSVLALWPIGLDRPAPPAAEARVRRRLQAWLAPTSMPPHDSVGLWTGVFVATATIILWFGLFGVRSGPPEAESVSRASAATVVDTSSPIAAAVVTRRRALAPPVFLIDQDQIGSAATSGTAGLGRGLVGRWSFAAGARLRDDSGNRRDCVERRVGSAINEGDLAPPDDAGVVRFLRHGWLECPQPEIAVGDSHEMTVATRFRSFDLPRNHRAVVSRAMEGGGGELFLLGFGGSRLILRSSLWRAKIVFPFPSAAGRWVHLAFTHHRDGTTRLFVDGREVGTAWGRPSAAAAIRAPLILGAGVKRRTTAGGHPMHQFWGGIDDVRVYDRALAADEIAVLAETTSLVAEAQHPMP